MSARSTRIVAIHEAGHAVAAYLLAEQIRPAALCHSPLKFTATYPDDIARIERQIVVLYAGPLAQRKFSPRSRWRVSGAADLERVPRLHRRFLAGSDRRMKEIYARGMWQRAESFVEQHWWNITAVADALVEQRTLDRRGVKVAIARSLGMSEREIRKALAEQPASQANA